KKEGCFGLDMVPGAAVDYVVNLNSEPLPFDDDSIEYVYSCHALEHLTNFGLLLRELLRVCKHDASIEIWTPYGASRDASMPGHTIFVNEHLWEHWCYLFDRHWLGDIPGYFLWEESEYRLTPNIAEDLVMLNIPLEFAIRHMFDIAYEWCVRIRVKKDA